MINKEEIINIVLDICIYKGDNDGLSKKEYQAIHDLVKLYKKEKEKNKELEVINEEHQKLNGELQKKITELETENNNLLKIQETIKEKVIQEMGMSDLYEEKKHD